MKAKRTGRPLRSEPARKFGLTLGESEHDLLVAYGLARKGQIGRVGEES